MPTSSAGVAPDPLTGLLAAAVEGAGRVAIVDGQGIGVAWGRLLERAAGFAGFLGETGAPGDRLAIAAEACTDAVVALLGAFMAGWTVVPMPAGIRPAELTHRLTDAGVRVLVHGRGGAPTANAPTLRIELGPRFQTISPPTTPEPARARAPALVVYTSGTTGRSKGVVIGHAPLLRALAALGELWGMEADDTVSLSLPQFHVHGLCVGLLGALRVGARVLLHPGFDAATTVCDFAERGATVTMWVPTMVRRMLDHFAAHGAAASALRGARLLTVGSAALPAADHAAFEQHTGQRLLERYGMTETLITLSNPSDGERRPGSVGLPVPGAEIRVVDDDGQPSPAGAVGELLVRAPWLFDGYLGAPEATAACFREGWFATGDAVQRDADGYVRIVGRRSLDIIKSGGFKISAREIEDVLASHPQVAEVAVIGVPDSTWGERVVAVVVARDPGDARSDLAARLVAHAAEQLEDYKRPREVRVVEALPRNELGKLLKSQLREFLGSRAGDRGSRPSVEP